VNTLWKSDAILSPSDVRAIGCFVITAVPLVVGEADGHHHCYSSNAAGVNSVSPPNHLVTRHQLKDNCGRIILQRDGDHNLWPDGSYAEAVVMFTSTQVGHAPMQWNTRTWSRTDIISQYDGVSVYPHRRVRLQCDGNKDLIMDGS
jgi:hypothetical protein